MTRSHVKIWPKRPLTESERRHAVVVSPFTRDDGHDECVSWRKIDEERQGWDESDSSSGSPL